MYFLKSRYIYTELDKVLNLIRKALLQSSSFPLSVSDTKIPWIRNEHRSGDVSVQIKSLLFIGTAHISVFEDETKPPPHQASEWNRQKEIERKEVEEMKQKFWLEQ